MSYRINTYTLTWLQIDASRLRVLHLVGCSSPEVSGFLSHIDVPNVDDFQLFPLETLPDDSFLGILTVSWRDNPTVRLFRLMEDVEIMYDLAKSPRLAFVNTYVLNFTCYLTVLYPDVFLRISVVFP